jgi:hypothetical protein
MNGSSKVVADCSIDATVADEPGTDVFLNSTLLSDLWTMVYHVE